MIGTVIFCIGCFVVRVFVCATFAFVAAVSARCCTGAIVTRSVGVDMDRRTAATIRATSGNAAYS